MEKGFIFDWSGTLSNNVEHWKFACDSIFKEFGLEPITLDEAKNTFTLPYMKFWSQHIPELTKERQDELYEKYIHEAGDPDLFLGVSDVLKYLAQRDYKMFVVSSDHISKLHSEIESSGIADYFSDVKGFVHEKGNVIAGLVVDYQLDPEYSYYIGDTSGDIEAGKEAGVNTIGITTGLQHKGILATSKPDYMIDDIIEIKNIVE